MSEKSAAWEKRVSEQWRDVKLLFDENLSRNLKDRLRDVFPAPLHVSDKELLSGKDFTLWEFDTSFGYAIVPKTKITPIPRAKEALLRVSFRYGRGNCPTWKGSVNNFV